MCVERDIVTRIRVREVDECANRPRHPLHKSKPDQIYIATCTTPHHTTPRHTTPHHTTPHHTTLHKQLTSYNRYTLTTHSDLAKNHTHKHTHTLAHMAQPTLERGKTNDHLALTTGSWGTGVQGGVAGGCGRWTKKTSVEGKPTILPMSAVLAIREELEPGGKKGPCMLRELCDKNWES